jgi:biotin carboxyl carrier protein
MQDEQPYSLTINQNSVLEVTPSEARNLDILEDGKGNFHVLYDGKAYKAVLEKENEEGNLYSIRVNGTRYEVAIADKYQRLVKQMGLTVGGAQKLNNVKAPMPGLVLDVMVHAGDEVKKGDALLVLEAMKMENVLKATGDGKVKLVTVKKGAAVDKGAILIEMV